MFQTDPTTEIHSTWRRDNCHPETADAAPKWSNRLLRGETRR
jgi:hypothetical protein